MGKRYRDFSEEELREYHRIKHKEWRDKNRVRYREIVRKSLAKHRGKYYNSKEYKKTLAKRELNNKKILNKIKSKKCVFCGKKETEAHHFDYNKPLNVYWMCKKCHSIFHMILRRTKL